MPWLGGFSAKPQSKDAPRASQKKKAKRPENPFRERPENPFREDEQEAAKFLDKPRKRRSSSRTRLDGGGTARTSSSTDKENATAVQERLAPLHDTHCASPSKGANGPHTNTANIKPVFSLFKRSSSRVGGAEEAEHKKEKKSPEPIAQHHLPDQDNDSQASSPRGKKSRSSWVPSVFRTEEAEHKKEKKSPEPIVQHHLPDQDNDSQASSPRGKKSRSSWVPSVFRTRKRADTKKTEPASAVTASAAYPQEMAKVHYTREGRGTEGERAMSLNHPHPREAPANVQGLAMPTLPNPIFAVGMQSSAPSSAYPEKQLQRSAQSAAYPGDQSWSLKVGTYLPNGTFTPSHLSKIGNPPPSQEGDKSSEDCNESYGESSSDSNAPSLAEQSRASPPPHFPGSLEKQNDVRPASEAVQMGSGPQTNAGAAGTVGAWSQKLFGAQPQTTTPHRQQAREEKSPSFWKRSIWPVGFSEKEPAAENQSAASPAKSQAQSLNEPKRLNLLNGAGPDCTHYTRPPAHSTEINLQQRGGAAPGAQEHPQRTKERAWDGHYETDALARRNLEVAMAGNVKVTTSLVTPSKPPALFGLGASIAHTRTRARAQSVRLNCTRVQRACDRVSERGSANKGEGEGKSEK